MGGLKPQRTQRLSVHGNKSTKENSRKNVTEKEAWVKRRRKESLGKNTLEKKGSI